MVDPFADIKREIQRWDVSPDGTVIAVVDNNGEAYAFPVQDASQAQYYGKYDKIAGFSYDSEKIYMSAGDMTYQIHMANGEQTELRMDEAIDLLDGTSEYKPLNSSEGVLVRTGVYDDGLDEFLTFVRVRRADTVSQLARYNALTSSVGGVRTTPNDEFAILEVSEVSGANYDDYLSLRSPSNIMTSLVREDGSIVRTFKGFQVYATSHW
jgi:hypothetical protein